MCVSATCVMRTPPGGGRRLDAVDVALRVDHQGDLAVMDEVAAITERWGLDDDDVHRMLLGGWRLGWPPR